MYHPRMIEPSRVFNFLSIQSDSETAESLLWKISPDLPYLEGHFPVKPILPAVALIDAAIHAVNLKTQKNCSLKGIKSAKFGDIIEPGTTLELRLSRKNESEWDVQYFKVPEKTEAIVKLQVQLRV